MFQQDKQSIINQCLQSGLDCKPILWSSKQMQQFLCDILKLEQLRKPLNRIKLTYRDFQYFEQQEIEEDLDVSQSQQPQVYQLVIDAQDILKQLTDKLENPNQNRNIFLEESKELDLSSTQVNKKQNIFDDMELEEDDEELAQSIPIHFINYDSASQSILQSDNRSKQTNIQTEQEQEFNKFINLGDKTTFFHKKELPYNAFDFSTGLDENLANIQDWLLNSQMKLADATSQQNNGQLKQQNQIQKGPPLLVLNSIKIGQNQSQASSGSYNVDKEGATLGKLKSNKIVLSKESISRKHCHISYNEETNNFYIQDQGSKSGTFLKLKNRAEIVKQGYIFEIGFNEIQVKQIQINGKQAKVLIKVIEGDESLKDSDRILSLEENIPFIIGGHSKCNFFIKNDKFIDLHHTKLNLYKGQITLEDLETKNGTWIRLSAPAMKSEPFLLTQGSELKINPFGFQVQLQNTSQNNSNNIGNNKLCLICQREVSNIVFRPCNHNVTCSNCAGNLTKCPKMSCGFIISDKKKIYRV